MRKNNAPLLFLALPSPSAFTSRSGDWVWRHFDMRRVQLILGARGASLNPSSGSRHAHQFVKLRYRLFNSSSRPVNAATGSCEPYPQLWTFSFGQHVETGAVAVRFLSCLISPDLGSRKVGVEPLPSHESFESDRQGTPTNEKARHKENHKPTRSTSAFWTSTWWIWPCETTSVPLISCANSFALGELWTWIRFIPQVTLERVLGLSVPENSALACDPSVGLIAYPAGWVILNSVRICIQFPLNCRFAARLCVFPTRLVLVRKV